ncbi:hypothetical protein [Nocardia panacis]|uniref:hypothetical protein n=1 Tax=Nocardia panacis TaxID=2340916 RepID=UPI0011C44B9A|nr:hypothetical protein [Nocardia panacis]
MPDEYDKFRKGLSNYERGLYFELGRAHERGETPDRGWVRQFRIETGKGERVLDSARTDGTGTEARERKSGKIDERALHQLRKERSGLASGQITRDTWERVAGENVHPKVADEIRTMEKDFPGRYECLEVARADALRAMKLGQSLVSQQLELFRAYELDRADRARKRLEHIREIVKARERAERLREMQRFREAAERGRAEARERVERAREEREREQARHREETARMREQLRENIQAQAQQIAKDREAGRTIDADRLYEIHKDLTQGLDAVREQEREETRDMLGTLGLGKEQAREMELNFELSREERRQDVVKDLNSIALAVQREDQRREAVEAQRREASEKAQREREAREAREAYGQALRERGISPEVAALIQHQQAPGLESEREREGQEPPQVQGRSRDIGGRGKGIERTRD